MKSTIITIIGAPGVGKTFLVKKLTKALKAKPLFEEAGGIPKRIIDNFKKDIRWFETTLWFRNRLIENIEKALKLKKQGKMVIMDTCLLSNELYTPVVTSGFERDILLKQAEIDDKYIPKPDLIILLDVSEKKMKEFTFKRGRDFDTNKKFIKKMLLVKKEHDKYYKKNKKKILLIKRDSLDFGNKKDIEKIVKKINSRLKGG